MTTDREQRDCKCLSVSKDCKLLQMDSKFLSGQTLNVNSVFVNYAHIVKGEPQKKGISPDIVQHQKLKYVKDISFVGHLSFVQPITNFPAATRSTCRGKTAPETWDSTDWYQNPTIGGDPS